jgi:hypothetical protein
LSQLLFFLSAHKTFKTPWGWGRDWCNTTLAMEEALPFKNIWWTNILRILPSTKLDQNLLKVVWKEVERNPKSNIQCRCQWHQSILIVIRITRKLTLFNSSSFYCNLDLICSSLLMIRCVLFSAWKLDKWFWTRFLLWILWCNQSVNHSKNNLLKFGYIIYIYIYIYIYILATYLQLLIKFWWFWIFFPLKNWQIWTVFFNEKSFVWVEIVFFLGSKFDENSPLK